MRFSWCLLRAGLVDEPQGTYDVDAALAVVRVGPGLAEVVRRLENPLADQRRILMAQLRHEQRGEAGDVRRGKARPARLRDGLVRAARGSRRGLRRGRRAGHPHSAELADLAGAAGCGDVYGRATVGAVRRARVHVVPRPIDSIGARGPGPRRTDRMG